MIDRRFSLILCGALTLAACGDDAETNDVETTDVAVADTAAAPDVGDDDAASEVGGADTGTTDAETDAETDVDTDAETDAPGLPEEWEPTADDFGCITDGEPVRRFYAWNALGDLEGTLAVANGEVDGDYPPGTILQLVPQEIMVKRLPGYSDESNDWEFLFVNTSAAGTEIQSRGVTDAVNAFGGNCFSCHVGAATQDYVCEQSGLCGDIPLTEELIRNIQEADPRCP